jgi:hypothetical protein
MTFSSSVFVTKTTLKAAVMALALAMVPALLMANPDDEQGQKAKIITGTEKPTECISSVHVNAIDGKQVYVQPLGFDIEPGKHTLTGRATINTSFCKAVGPSTGKDKVEPLEAEFEAGKTYYLGYDHSSNSRKDWKLVIWKVED